MNNWKIGPRIAAGFAVVMLIAAALGLYSYAKVGTIEKSANEIAANTLPSVFWSRKSEKVALSQMQHAIRGAGTSIDLDSNSGGSDARDREFTSYES